MAHHKKLSNRAGLRGFGFSVDFKVLGIWCPFGAIGF
jgi:hypothetical protein